MQYTALNTIPSLAGKPREIRVLFADIANEALTKGRTQDEAIFQGLAIVQQKEQKEIKKYVKPSVPRHVQAILDLKNNPQASQEALSTLQIENPTEDTLTSGKEVVGAEFDARGRLILKFKDGKTITSNVAPITVERTSIVVTSSGNAGTVSTITEGLDALTYSGEDLQRVDLADGSYKLLYWTAGVLQYVDHFQAGQTVRKTLNYILGVLTSVLTEIL